MRKVAPLALTLLLHTSLGHAQAPEAQPAAEAVAPAVAPAPTAAPTAPAPAAPSEASPAASERPETSGAPAPAPAAPPAPTAVAAEAPAASEAPRAAVPRPAPRRGRAHRGYPVHPSEYADHDLPDPQLLYLELANVSEELEVLRAERARHRIAAPIALMAAGLGVGVVSSIIAFSALETAWRIEDIGTSRRYHDLRRYDLNDSGLVNWRDEEAARTVARTFGVISVAGLATGLAGAVVLSKRKALRSAHDAEIAGLKRRKRELIRSLRYSGHALPGRLELGVSGSF